MLLSLITPMLIYINNDANVYIQLTFVNYCIITLVLKLFFDFIAVLRVILLYVSVCSLLQST